MTLVSTNITREFKRSTTIPHSDSVITKDRGEHDNFNGLKDEKFELYEIRPLFDQFYEDPDPDADPNPNADALYTFFKNAVLGKTFKQLFKLIQFSIILLRIRQLDKVDMSHFVNINQFVTINNTKSRVNKYLKMLGDDNGLLESVGPRTPDEMNFLIQGFFGPLKISAQIKIITKMLPKIDNFCKELYDKLTSEDIHDSDLFSKQVPKHPYLFGNQELINVLLEEYDNKRKESQGVQLSPMDANKLSLLQDQVRLVLNYRLCIIKC